MEVNLRDHKPGSSSGFHGSHVGFVHIEQLVERAVHARHFGLLHIGSNGRNAAADFLSHRAIEVGLAGAEVFTQVLECLVKLGFPVPQLTGKKKKGKEK